MIKKTVKFLKKLSDEYKNRKLMSKLTPEERKLIEQIRKKKLTYLPKRKLTSLIYTCNEIKASNLSGIFIEAGCALGGSSILISKLKDPNSPFYIYDVFGMIPPPTQEDTQEVHKRYRTILEGKSSGIGGDKYYGYEENLYDVVLSNLRDFEINCQKESVTLIKGLVQDTMKINQPVVFAHIDVDWYDPVKTCLEQIFPNLVVGGSLILDDYHVWGGCRKATDEYLRKHVGQFSMDDSFGSMKITKLK